MLPAHPFGRLLGRAVSCRPEELRSAGKRVLVAGLGNYGLRGTRHSIGMAILNHMAHKLSVGDQWKTDWRCCSDVAIANLGEVEVVLVKPRRLMNVNGLCLVGAAKAYKLGVENIYLVHDDLDKPLGKVALKLGGSARNTDVLVELSMTPAHHYSHRGHNGVRSCISALQSDSMVRIRVGIGRPLGDAAIDRYVLGRFTPAEQELLPQVYEQAVAMLLEHIQQSDHSKTNLATGGEPVMAPLGTEGA